MNFDTFEIVSQLEGHEKLVTSESDGCVMKYSEEEETYFFTCQSEQFGEYYQSYKVVERTDENIIAEMTTFGIEKPELYIVKDSISLKSKIEFYLKTQTMDTGEKVSLFFRYSNNPN